MSQFTTSTGLYNLSSAGRSVSSVDSVVSFGSSTQLFECFQVPTYDHTSALVARVVLKSSLAQRIAGARKHKTSAQEASMVMDNKSQHEKPTENMTRLERIQAKFLENEKEWKKDACKDADKRIAQSIASLGF